MSMKYVFNQFITKILPYLPFFLVRAVAIKYVAGETSEEALSTVQHLNNQGFSVTLDILGEHTTDETVAKEITNNYLSLLQNIHKQHLDCNLSIKPSHIGMDISTSCIDENMSLLISTARNFNNFIRIDMEDSNATDSTIELFNKYKEQYDQIGIVFQAYLYRTENDLLTFKGKSEFNFRLCKGIYRESPDIAITDRQSINENFLRLLHIAFENNIYIGIATHDISLLKEIYKIINKHKVPKDKFEFQVLYGVPMSGWLERHLENDYKVRIYVPFGKDWYDYSIRRLKENPNIAGYVIRDIFRK